VKKNKLEFFGFKFFEKRKKERGDEMLAKHPIMLKKLP
jgi:hypothetical protein